MKRRPSGGPEALGGAATAPVSPTDFEIAPCFAGFCDRDDG